MVRAARDARSGPGAVSAAGGREEQAAVALVDRPVQPRTPDRRPSDRGRADDLGEAARPGEVLRPGVGPRVEQALLESGRRVEAGRVVLLDAVAVQAGPGEAGRVVQTGSAG